ncbi:helix-turn-helix transcriptional regulator [Saccharopolyspora mangrovi]|uniref:Helix-turn-helix transcriptional regulator n=1 Tax=Saccharopolyspora mangrovi TaxID=3082379 RepID=A0ABU6AIS9_9PSEU|nr:helix-turn-helix transcriptional regulator [Saccharopolyspora sp. S2-29]MEB3371294.1 helix-turn-helix transcriptional regulator [Saccharopolyspora sp. S2-29]
MAEALRSRHFGRIFYAYRYEHRPVITQAALARWLHMTQAQVSRLERVTKAPTDLDKLALWASTLHIPESELWFRLPPRTEAPHRRAHKTAFGWFRGTTLPTLMQKTERAPVTIESVKDTTAMFRGLDNRFGGGHARGLVGAYLADEVAPAMHIYRQGQDHIEFVVAVAELNQLAGWMAYDVGDNLAGRRHLQQALQLCQRASDDALSAEMLAGMSHQAAHARNGAVSVGLAQAARDTAAGTGLAALESETAVMEAHGLALLRDKRGSIAALKDAEDAFSRADRQDHPHWLSYYDAAYLAAKMAHCMREFGELRAAERFARRSLEMSAGYERGKLFNTALLASILAELREIDEACAVGRDALQLGRKLQSARTVVYLQDFATRLRRHQAAPAVAELASELAAIGISLDAEPTA